MGALLLENSADIWVKDKRGQTPYCLARINGMRRS